VAKLEERPAAVDSHLPTRESMEDFLNWMAETLAEAEKAPDPLAWIATAGVSRVQARLGEIAEWRPTGEFIDDWLTGHILEDEKGRLRKRLEELTGEKLGE
jgi:hypothetical protein